MALADKEALVKIGAVLPAPERARASAILIHAMTTAEMSDALRARIDAIERAVEAKTHLPLSCADADSALTTRTIRPLGLWFRGKVWTLVSWCALRDDFRIFGVDRISEIGAQGPFRPEAGKSLIDFYAQENQEKTVGVKPRSGHGPNRCFALLQVAQTRLTFASPGFPQIALGSAFEPGFGCGGTADLPGANTGIRCVFHVQRHMAHAELGAKQRL